MTQNSTLRINFLRNSTLMPSGLQRLTRFPSATISMLLNQNNLQREERICITEPAAFMDPFKKLVVEVVSQVVSGSLPRVNEKDKQLFQKDIALRG